MAEVIDLGGGDYAEVDTDLGYQDRKWWRIQVDKVRRAKGASSEAPGTPGELTMEDNIGLIEVLTARLVIASSIPSLVPWTPEAAEALSHSHGLEACDKIEDAVIVQMNRLNGIAAPKPETPQTGTGGSASTSGDGPPSPLPASPAMPSSTPPA